MHIEALAFVARSIGAVDTSKTRVLDIGSFDVNGSPRLLFAAAPAYVGIDERDGPGVDVAQAAKDYTPDELFDVVVTCETLEHAEPSEVIDCAWRSLNPGGLLILTAAGPDRAPHGVDGAHVGSERYNAIDKRILARLLKNWEDVAIEYGASHGQDKGDIYATARKPKSAKGKAKTVKAAEPTKDDDAE